MQVVQQLYEGIDLGKAGTVGLVTYIRTDSVRVSDEAVDRRARIYLDAQYGERVLPGDAQPVQGPQERAGRPRGHPSHLHGAYARQRRRPI